MKIKELELKQESSWLKRTLKSAHTRKTVIYIVIGAAAGIMLLLLSQAEHLDRITGGDILQNALLGGFFGFFITNSPCARGRC